jgi:RHS repeat-associated protein
MAQSSSGSSGNSDSNNGKGNSGNSNAGNGNANGNSNAGSNSNRNGNGKYNNPGQGNKYGIYKNGGGNGSSGGFELPLNIEAERYQYLGLSTTLNKEFSDKGSPYAEYYTANNQVMSQKMFGLHGLITPGKEDTLKTNGGLMYYQYDGANSVTELTNRHGDVIEKYRYDAFGNILTGITAPYNTTGYTGQDYDELAGLVQMDARWYAPNTGRFMSQDTYMGDIYTSQSLNRYAYVMNNPVNMWDPTGHVPEWVGQESYFTFMPRSQAVDHAYFLKESWSSSTGWYLLDKITTRDSITYKYKATISNTWIYDHLDLKYDIAGDSEVGDINYEYLSYTLTTETYTETDYYYNDVVKKASEYAKENEQYIKDLAGDPSKDSDPPAVSISTKQIGNGKAKVIDTDKIIVENTGTQTTGTKGLIAGAVQSELNDILGSKLKVDGWYGNNTAGALSDFQKKYGLTVNGKLDAKTFYQLESKYLKEKPQNEIISNHIINYSADKRDPVEPKFNKSTSEEIVYKEGDTTIVFANNGEAFLSTVQTVKDANGVEHLVPFPNDLEGYGQANKVYVSPQQFVSLIIGFTPTDGLKDTIDLIAGEDVITGEKLNRWIMLGLIITPEIIDQAIKQGAKNGDEVIGFFKGTSNPKIWDDIVGTADNMPGTEIPATFQIKVEGNFSFTNPTTGTNVLWTNANATEHMGEYISRFGLESQSIGVRSQAMLESYSSALNTAMNEIGSLPAGKYFNTYGGWELGINTETGVVYHALMK